MTPHDATWGIDSTYAKALKRMGEPTGGLKRPPLALEDLLRVKFAEAAKRAAKRTAKHNGIQSTPLQSRTPSQAQSEQGKSVSPLKSATGAVGGMLLSATIAGATVVRKLSPSSRSSFSSIPAAMGEGQPELPVAEVPVAKPLVDPAPGGMHARISTTLVS